MKVVWQTRQVTWGGGETFLSDVVDAMRKGGDAVWVRAPVPSEIDRRVDRGERLSVPDLFIANDFRSVWRGYPLAIRARRKVFVCHGWWQASLLRSLVCWLLNFEVVTLSTVVAQHVRDAGALHDPAVLPVGAGTRYRPPEPEERRRARSGLGVAEHKKVMVWVGRYQDVKRPEMFVAAARALRGAGWFSVMVTPGRAEHPDEQRIRREVDQAAEVGYVRRVLDDPLEAYWAADVFVSTSEFESLGIAHLEALACGVPVVTTAAGGPSDFMTPGVGATLSADCSLGELCDSVIEVARQSPMAPSQAIRATVSHRGAAAVADILRAF